jgi:hypothetical protein
MSRSPVIMAVLALITPALAAELPKSGSFKTPSAFKGIEQATQVGGRVLSHTRAAVVRRCRFARLADWAALPVVAPPPICNSSIHCRQHIGIWQAPRSNLGTGDRTHVNRGVATTSTSG